MKPDEAVRHEFITGQKSSMPPPSNRLTAPSRSSNDLHASPVKRTSTLTTPSSNRPLPDPPATTFKNGTAVRSRDGFGGSGASPVKSGPGPARRQSVLNGSVNTYGGAGNKRTSSGAVLTAGANLGILSGPTGGSGLPRVTRSTSAKQIQDAAGMASAGASVAMGRRQ